MRRLAGPTAFLILVLLVAGSRPAPAQDQESTLFPSIQPYQTGYLAVEEPHELYYEVSGNPEGKPVICLHGGPGAGCYPRMRRYFDPARYRIVLYD